METQYQVLVKQSLQRIRNQIEQKGSKTLRSLGRFFRETSSFDRNQNINQDEFIVALKELLNLNIPQQEVKILISYFDRDKNGKINLEEFLVGIRGKMNDIRHEYTEKAFHSLDMDGNGKASKEEIIKKFNFNSHPLYVQGVKNKEQILKEFFEFFDGNFDGFIEKTEFFQYYDTVSASIQKDEHFIALMSMAWNLQ